MFTEEFEEVLLSFALEIFDKFCLLRSFKLIFIESGNREKQLLEKSKTENVPKRARLIFKTHEEKIRNIYQFIELFGKLSGLQICLASLPDFCEKLGRYAEKLKKLVNFDIVLPSAFIYYFRNLETEEQKISQKQLEEGNESEK